MSYVTSFCPFHQCRTTVSITCVDSCFPSVPPHHVWIPICPKDRFEIFLIALSTFRNRFIRQTQDSLLSHPIFLFYSIHTCALLGITSELTARPPVISTRLLERLFYHFLQCLSSLEFSPSAAHRIAALQASAFSLLRHILKRTVRTPLYAAETAYGIPTTSSLRLFFTSSHALTAPLRKLHKTHEHLKLIVV